jgi:MFS transporter, PPP family, 3-phenylpropionic acid transporter
MGPHKPAIAADGFALRLSVFYGAIFIGLGIQMPFLPIWLAAKGLDATAIGTVLATPLLLRIVTVPGITGAADRFGALRAALVMSTASAAIVYALLGLADGFWPILILLALGSACFASTLPLADAYALKGLAVRGRSYGSVRLWGSGAFILGNLGAGLLLDWMHAIHLIWVLVTAMAVMAMLAAALRRQEGLPSSPHQPGANLAFLRSPAFLSLAIAASLIQGSHALFYGFSTLDWTRAGFDGRVVGALWAIGVVAEMVLFAVSGRLPAAFGPSRLLIVGAIGAVVRWAAMALDPPALLLPVLQCLHALSFGATHLGSVQFLARAAPDRLGATAQGYLAVVLGAAMAAFTGLSGWLYAAYGGRAYGAMVLIAAAGLLFALVARRFAPNESD